MRIVLLSVLVVLSGCSGYQYVSAPQYVPLNTQKGDLKANISFTHAQLGYSVGNHVSVFAMGHHRKSDSDFLFGSKEGGIEERYAEKSHEINVGASYFGGNSRFIYEVHAGGGAGKIDYEHAAESPYAYLASMRADKANVFIQPSFALRLPTEVQRYLEFGVFTKFAGQRYYNIATDNFSDADMVYELDPTDQYFHNRSVRNLFFVEPGITFRAGGRWIKSSITGSAPISLQGDKVRYRSGSVYVSLFLDLHLLRKQ